MKTRLFTVIKITFSILILFVLFKSVNIDSIQKICHEIDYKYLLIVAVIIPISISIRAYRWIYLMNFKQEKKLVDFKMGMNITLVGVALNIFMPAQSGDIAKSYFGYKWSGIKERMVSISLYDKIFGISSVAFLGIFSGIFYRNYYFSLFSLLAFIPFLIIFVIKKNKMVLQFLYKISNKFFKRKLDLLEVINNFNFDKSLLIKSFLISILGWLFSYTVLWLSFKIVLANSPLLFIFMVSPILTLGRLFPFTLNGIGSDEAIIVFLFKSIKISTSQSLYAALIYRIILMILPGLAGLLIIMLRRERAKNYTTEELR